ncbi:hypothetical protein B1772_06765 [Dehalococcoides mccartyi]|jgi:hypothetical protein|uniref:NotI family restriction endonuclease n=1 Tax=Dehalococcoides mccartyi TaxID=61435 RepID=UPI000870C1C4|nr:NotI family restriction endonuclease [Dehalococcoides mccartyi]AOV99951.1 hypothetical protein DCWBC2_1342 [Dehalococcoides mccartyi]AQX75169.1 hypothetical protein B1776_06455 [Dehalococcoides mccartyi]AQY73746.1 hypothetical protein B1772_06765 [Dehalococcoides mccartyi]BEL01446.1 hypothetical protein DMOBY_12990 [Dehalococcoides mccartyi]
MAKKILEAFGQKVDSFDKTKAVSSGYICPFNQKKCSKQSRLLKYPMGTCTVDVNDSHVIICPDRYVENDIIFVDIANAFFGSTNNTIVFPEVGMNDVGSFDFVIVKHAPMRPRVEDFVVVEIQSDSTTGTGALVTNISDIMEDNLTKDKYGFGMNTYNTIKLSFVQMLIKGQTMEHWKKNIVWVLQDFVFSNMTKRFALNQTPFKTDKLNHFFIYDLEDMSDKYSIKLENKFSYTVAELLMAFQRQADLPSLEDFNKNLEERTRAYFNNNVNLKLDMS